MVDGVSEPAARAFENRSGWYGEVALLAGMLTVLDSAVDACWPGRIRMHGALCVRGSWNMDRVGIPAAC